MTTNERIIAAILKYVALPGVSDHFISPGYTYIGFDIIELLNDMTANDLSDDVNPALNQKGFDAKIVTIDEGVYALKVTKR